MTSIVMMAGMKEQIEYLQQPEGESATLCRLTTAHN
jgi:hypothetical protein